MYKIIFSEKSRDDLNDITNIIFKFTLSEDITDKIYKRIVEKIYSLQLFPHINVLYKDYRVLLVNKKYKVFYKIDEEFKIVKVYRIFLSSSNYQKII